MYKLIVILVLSLTYSTIQAEHPPFSVNNDYLTVWNGESYEPFFVKGVNLGVARPGTYPGEMDATVDQYKQWFKEIKDAGFNAIRIYTLHRPQFYEELLAYNTANPQHPLFFFQGIWLNEELQGYSNDLYFMTDTFKVEIQENVDCVHGRRTIAQRFGKAYGEYTADVSKWNIGYIIGREVYPHEIMTTNERNSMVSSFVGKAFEIYNASPSEAWFTSKLDFLVDYERTNYNTQRPVSVSSWPTLDPLHHPTEPNRMEDTVSVDMSKVKYIDAPAGMFISYHAYPYYPDFISASPDYNGTFDRFGPNSYKAYLMDLKRHYEDFPLIIAEFGVPSSWGVAHYSSSGMNHGGYDEHSQGETNLRLLQSIYDAKLGGGIHFAWIDEWFKNNWITDVVETGEKTMWHNITAAEQNFGLKKYVAKRDWQTWERFDSTQLVHQLDVRHNYDFFELQLHLKNNFEILDELWVALDTYDALLGEIILPNGTTLNHGAEFVVHITRHSARLYVTEAYDLFGLWHRQTTPAQQHQSIATTGRPWKIVRWRNNEGPMDIQYIGDLKVNIAVQPPSSKDAVLIDNNKISIRLPWTLINFTDPSQLMVFHDDKSTPGFESRLSDGIAVSVNYKSQLFTTNSRYTWQTWDRILRTDVEEEFKPSYWTMYNNLPAFNSPAVARTDRYTKTDNATVFRVAAKEGVLQNDFDMDGSEMTAVLIDAPSNGFVELKADGSFVYMPRSGFFGVDRFTYAVFDGHTLSNTAQVVVVVELPTRRQRSRLEEVFNIFPYPASDSVTVESEIKITSLKLVDVNGRLVKEYFVNAHRADLDVTGLQVGHYILILEINGQFFSEKVLIAGD